MALPLPLMYWVVIILYDFESHTHNPIDSFVITLALKRASYFEEPASIVSVLFGPW